MTTLLSQLLISAQLIILIVLFLIYKGKSSLLSSFQRAFFLFFFSYLDSNSTHSEKSSTGLSRYLGSPRSMSDHAQL